MKLKTTETIKMIFVCTAVFSVCTSLYAGQHKIELELSDKKVPKYEKLEMLIKMDNQYDNPFDPNEVDLVVLLGTPGNEKLILPAFYCQDYERRQFKQQRKVVN
jgi:hypothetical protein